jgi:uncharacterized alkaline shock family protein YloU
MTASAPADAGSPGSTISTPVESRGQATLAMGRNELGSIIIRDGVVAKIAACAAVEIPDAGAAASRVMGRAIPGGRRLGMRATDLEALPKTTAEIDGRLAFLSVQLSVRWPASVPDTTAQVRQHIQERVQELTGLIVSEVRITVADLVTSIAPLSRVR